ncbi:hypothetical protein HMPREF1870_00059 [Bacteroidales bacterium KA00344]|nr:hypothetical protein HMPREF1870_00059 [Bacteroidales bacterium KA00344]
MKKNIKNMGLLTIISMAVLQAVSCSNKDEKLFELDHELRYTNIEVGVGEATQTPVQAVGVELDPHFFAQNLTRNDGAKEADWDNIVVNRVKKMQIQQLRVMVIPSWWEPVNDNADPNNADMSKFTFDSQEMQSLYHVLDMAQQNNIGVNLVLWGCPTSISLLSGINNGQMHFLCDTRSHAVNPGWMAGTDKYEEFAECFSTLVKYLIENKHYTCINAITPFNEPDSHIPNYGRLMWQGDLATMSFPDTYAPMVKVLDKKFKADDIRDKVKFNLGDNTDGTPDYTKACSAALTNNEADMYNSHVYKFGYDTPNSTWLAWEKYNIESTSGKSHFVGEFGFPATGSARQAGIDTYMRGVQLVRAALNYLNAGACGVSYWSLFDQYYGRNDGYDQMQQLGLWRYVKKAYTGDAEAYGKIKDDYDVRPQYYAYSLLTRFVRKGAKVFPLDLKNEYAAGSAFLTAEGKWVYVFANATDCDLLLNVANAQMASGLFDVYKYQDGRLPEGDNLIESSAEIKSEDGLVKTKMMRSSVMVLVEK